MSLFRFGITVAGNVGESIMRALFLFLRLPRTQCPPLPSGLGAPGVCPCAQRVLNSASTRVGAQVRWPLQLHLVNEITTMLCTRWVNISDATLLLSTPLPSALVNSHGPTLVPLTVGLRQGCPWHHGSTSSPHKP